MEYLYRHYGDNDALLYVGISLNVGLRLKTHETGSVWFNEVKKITIEHYASREDVMRAETEAIINEKPKYNIKKRNAGTGAKYRARVGDKLSQYERDILRLIVYGMDDREIARAVGISPATAQSRRRDLLIKTGQHSSPKLIAFGRKLLGLRPDAPEQSAFSVPTRLDEPTQTAPLELVLDSGT